MLHEKKSMMGLDRLTHTGLRVASFVNKSSMPFHAMELWDSNLQYMLRYRLAKHNLQRGIVGGQLAS